MLFNILSTLTILLGTATAAYLPSAYLPYNTTNTTYPTATASGASYGDTHKRQSAYLPTGYFSSNTTNMTYPTATASAPSYGDLRKRQSGYLPYSSSNTTFPRPSEYTEAPHNLTKRQCGGMMINCDGHWRCCFDSVSEEEFREGERGLC